MNNTCFRTVFVTHHSVPGESLCSWRQATRSPPSGAVLPGRMSGIMRRLGSMIRETGQALDRLGCRLQGNNAYLEDGRLSPLWWNVSRMLHRRASQL